MNETQVAVSEIISNAVAPATTEAVTEQPVPTQEPVKVETDKVDDKFASKFAALTKREKMLIAKEQELKALDNEIKQYKSVKDTAKRNPIKYLESLGLSYNDITEFVLNNQDLPEEKKIKLELEEIKNKLSSREKAEEEAKKQEAQNKYTQVKTSFINEIKETIKNNSETYEFTALQDNHEEIVYSVIEQYHATNGKILDVKEACDMVEKHFESQAEKIRTLKKFNKVAEPKPVVQPEKKQSFTLNNDSAISAPPQNEEKYSYEKSLERAKAMLKWT